MRRSGNRTAKVAAGAAMVVALSSAGVAVASKSADREMERHPALATACRTTSAASNGTVRHGQTISVTVPRTSFLKIDARSRIIAAATNTGCAPRQGDDVYVIGPDGRYTLATGVRLDRIEWRGDFSRAADFQRQSGEARLR